MSEQEKKNPDQTVSTQNRTTEAMRKALNDDVVEKMARNIGYTSEELLERNANKLDSNELFRLIKPFFEEAGSSDEKIRSLKTKKSTETEDKTQDEGKRTSASKEQRSAASNQKDTELASAMAHKKDGRDGNNELVTLLGENLELTENLDLDAHSSNEHKILAKRRVERKNMKDRVMAIVAHIQQYKSGAITHDQLMARVDKILPLKSNPAVRDFMRQNGVGEKISSKGPDKRVVAQGRQVADGAKYGFMSLGQPKLTTEQSHSIEELLNKLLGFKKEVSGPSSSLGTTSAKSQHIGASRGI